MKCSADMEEAEAFLQWTSRALRRISTMAKGMGNGFPVGGILIAPHIKPKPGMLGTTFGGNQLACAAALAVLEVMEQDDLIEKAKQRGQYLMNRLKAIKGIENVRGRGLMVGFDVPDELKDLRKNLLYKHNIFTGEAKPNVIRLLPALTITRKLMDEFLDVLQENMRNDKTELLGIIDANKIELLGKIDGNKTELLGIIGANRIELLQKFNFLEQKINQLENSLTDRMNKNFQWMIGIMIAVVGLA